MDLDYLVSQLCFKARAKLKISKNSEPTSWQQVLKSPDKDKWIKAIFSEFKQLALSSTFLFLPLIQLPKDRKILKNRLVLRLKKDQHNNPLKYKARLVAKGFMQVEGLDYTETFASTSIPPTWRVLLAIAAYKDWEIEQVDFIGAFLNADL